VAVPDAIWFAFILAFGCCIGSFLNVVIYRLPREKSLIRPGSACPACNKPIRFYDNIPLLSWLLLGRKCRYCKAPISARYFVIELLTGSVFLGLFVLYYRTGLRPGLGSLSQGRWLVYVLHVIMLSSFIATSAIDLEYWVIPLSICWFVTAVGFIGSAVGGYIIPAWLIDEFRLLPRAGTAAGSLAAGAAVGLGISWLLTVTGLIRRSYQPADSPGGLEARQESADSAGHPQHQTEPQFNHRLESLREIVFLLPIIACAVAAYLIASRVVSQHLWSSFPSTHPVLAGFLGSVWGYFVGCGVVWAVRILGTLGFGKEAMGLGDVHLMGAAGAVLGPVPAVVAFFIAPFYGLAWAGCQMFFRKIRQIPYGPFLSLGILTVMIFHGWILEHISMIFYGR